MKKILAFSLLICIHQYAFSQQSVRSEEQLDSMKQVLDSAKDLDLTERYFTYQRIINHYGHGPYDSLWKYIDGAVAFFMNQADPKFKYAATFLKARSFASTGRLDSSKVWYRHSKHFAKQMQQDDKIARIDFEVAYILLEQDSLFKALDHAKRSEQVFEQGNNLFLLRSSQQQLGTIMLQMQRYGDAMAYQFKELALAQNSNDSAGAYHNLYGPMMLLEKYDSAKWVLDEAVARAEKGSVSYFLRLINYSHLYLQEDFVGFNPEKALDYLDIVEEDYLATYGTRSDSLDFHINSASAYLFLGLVNKAEPHVDAFKELANKTKSKIDEYKYLWLQSEYHAAAKEYQKAYQYHVQYKELKDDYANANIQNQLYMLSRSYEVEKREAEIQVLNVEKELQMLEAGTFLKQRNGFLIFAACLLIGGAVIARQSWLRKRTNGLLVQKRQQLEVAVEEKETLLKEIHHRVKNNLQVISSLLNLQAESLSDESALQAITDGQNRVKSMSLIHQRLYQENDLRGVDVHDYLTTLIPQLINSFSLDKTEIDYRIDVGDMKLDVDTLVPLGLIINELVTNSLKHAFEEVSSGIIELKMREEANQLHVSIKDNGRGLDESELQKANSFGWKMIGSLSRKLKADLSILNDDGTVVDILVGRYKLVI